MQTQGEANRGFANNYRDSYVYREKRGVLLKYVQKTGIYKVFSLEQIIKYLSVLTQVVVALHSLLHCHSAISEKFCGYRFR